MKAEKSKNGYKTGNEKILFYETDYTPIKGKSVLSVIRMMTLKNTGATPQYKVVAECYIGDRQKRIILKTASKTEAVALFKHSYCAYIQEHGKNFNKSIIPKL